jgi:hypothetical protein
MWEVWKMHMYRKYGSRTTHGAVVEEQFSARPSLGIFAPPSLALCDIPPIPGHKKADTEKYLLKGSYQALFNSAMTDSV